MERVDKGRYDTKSLIKRIGLAPPPSRPGERILINLNSSASTKTHPGNHGSDFINDLQQPLHNPEGRKYHARLLSVALGGTLARDSPRTDFVQISIYEVQGQRHGVEFNRIIGHVPLPPPGEYRLHEVKNAPPLPLRFEVLNEVQVTLRNKRGEQITLARGQLPTLVEIEITEGEMEEQFTITCNSYHQQTHPSNTINEFTCPIPSALDLHNYEVALQNLTFPSDVYERDDAVLLETKDIVFRWRDLKVFHSTNDFLGRVASAIRRSALRHDLTFGLIQNDNSPVTHVYIKRNVRNDIDPNDAEAVRRYGQPLWIRPSVTFSRACGQLWNLERSRELRPGDVWEFQGSPNIALAKPGIVAALHCSIIAPNFVGEDQQRLMQLLPVRDERNVMRRYYEPSQLLFHNVMNRPFDSISFKLTEPHGELRRFVTDDAETRDLYITLLFRKRRNTHH